MSQTRSFGLAGLLSKIGGDFRRGTFAEGSAGGHGKTQEMREFSRRMSYRQVKPRETRERDRSLAGKARIRARRAERRAA